MNNTAYSPYKGLKWKDRLDDVKTKGFCAPTYVEIDLTNKCQFKCTHCFYRVHDLDGFDKNKEIPLNLVLDRLREMKEYGVKAIEITGGGEPTLHPKFNTVIRAAKTLGFKQALVTNGGLLHTVDREIINEFSWVRFSVDAASKETFLKVHGVTDLVYDKVMSNIKNFINYKKKTNSNCITGFSFIVSDVNYEEILLAAELAKKMGFDNIRFSLAMTPQKGKIFEGIWDNIVEQLHSVKKLETDTFKVFTFSNRIKDITGEQKSKHCWYHHLVGVFSPDGWFPCCRLKGVAKYKIGEINESFKSVWEGQTRKVFIESISKGCPVSCWMTKKNDVIDYVMNDDAIHVEFV